MSLFNRKKSSSGEISLAPMMDMVFILLIFFVVTSSFNKERGIDINKPKSSTSQELKKGNLFITITQSGSLFIDNSEVNLNSLLFILKQYVQRNPNQKAVIISDKQVSVEKLVKVMDQCNKAGIKKTSLSTKELK